MSRLASVRVVSRLLMLRRVPCELCEEADKVKGVCRVLCACCSRDIFVDCVDVVFGEM